MVTTPALRTIELKDVDVADPAAFVVPVLSDVRPLAGVASLLDWRLCGALSRPLLSNWFQGDRGERALLPGFGRLKRSRVFLMGMGPSRALLSHDLVAEFGGFAEVLAAAGATQPVLVAPVSPEVPELEPHVAEAAVASQRFAEVWVLDRPAPSPPKRWVFRA